MAFSWGQPQEVTGWMWWPEKDDPINFVFVILDSDDDENEDPKARNNSKSVRTRSQVNECLAVNVSQLK